MYRGADFENIEGTRCRSTGIQLELRE